LPEKLLKLSKIKEDRPRDLELAKKGKRLAYSQIARDFIPYTVYDRYKIFPGAKFFGPAIIEERESTIVAGEDTEITVDEYGFVWIEIKGG
jgi:N-methylhydantoinase A